MRDSAQARTDPACGVCKQEGRLGLWIFQISICRDDSGCACFGQCLGLWRMVLWCPGRCRMLKHRGFPGRLSGTDFQFVIRRANPRGITPITRRERYHDRRPADRRADTAFLQALWDHFGNQPFERGNLDAGRLSWLFGREVLPAEDPFDPASYEALLKLDVDAVRESFPDVVLDEGDW